jgi:ankyrin repeat protein
MASLLDEIVEGRCDLVFDYLAEGHRADETDGDGVSLLQWCAYYGDVSAMRYLLQNGASLHSLGELYGLNTAAYHGHWKLCRFLIDQGANVNRPDAETGETPLHSAVSKSDLKYNTVLRVLLDAGANPNCATKPSVETGAFMRDCRTKGETPLHRAAAFCNEEAIQMLLDAGAKVDARDMNGETPLSWASWYGRSVPVLRKLLYGRYSIRPD